jgi:autophagy-related protein 16-1
VRTAYIQSLESQVSALRDEMAVVYKTQGQNAQRLLAMNETLREREDAARMDGENLRLAREEVGSLRRKVDQHGEQMAEKDRAFQVCFIYIIYSSVYTYFLKELTDEFQLLHLEFTQVEQQKDNLKKDNATLVQRWIDKQNTIGDVLNERNDAWYEDLHSRQQQGDMAGNGVRTKPSQESLASSISFVSGNGSRPFQPPMGRDQDRKGVDQTRGGLLLNPNG